MPADLPDDEPYVMLPEPLALDLRDSPLAVGIYLLVARAFLVQQVPIPLSADDIDSYDGSDNLRRGAILRAITRLRKGGWLLPQPQRGQKTAYLPAWGRVSGTIRPWNLEAAGLDRPRAVRAVRVPRAIIDVCLGRLTPHPRHAALIERYVTRPPVTLRDLGAYGLAWAGLPMATPALMYLGLVSSSGPLPPPAWESLLARISQRPLFDTDPQAPGLSPRGLQRAGLLVAPAAPPAEPPSLFFVPQDMIGSVIPSLIPSSISPLIASEGSREETATAAGSTETPHAGATLVTTGTQGTQATLGIKGNPSSTPAAGGRRSGSSSSTATRCPPVHPSKAYAALSPQKIPPAGAAPAALIESCSLAEQALRELGVYPSVAQKYREMPLELIERAQTIAQRMSGRRSLAATIVQLLQEEQLNSGWLRQGWPDLFLSPMGEDESDCRSEESRDEEAPPPARSDDDPRAQVHVLLGAVLCRRIFPFIERQQIVVDANSVSIEVPTWFSCGEQAAVNKALRDVAAQLGLRTLAPVEKLPALPPAPSPGIRASVAALPPRSERPEWMSPEQWSQLHMMARAAFIGSRWEDGEIVGSGPGTTKLLRTHFAELVARLRPSREDGAPLETGAS